MKIYNEHVALQSQKPREVFNITTQVKAALEKSGAREGIALVSSLHSSTAIIVHEDRPGLLDHLAAWLSESLLPGEFQGALLPHQVAVPFTEGRLDLSAGQALLLLELDGLRPRRIVIKIIGE
jgi:thiamine phosphate synthase YjbQ (UPF0047 family)